MKILIVDDEEMQRDMLQGFLKNKGYDVLTAPGGKEALQIFKEYGEAGYLDYEIKHKEIIDRFGRYPHRNKVLERESTDDEVTFLKENPGF